MSELFTILAVLAFQALGLALASRVYHWGKYTGDEYARLLLASAWPVVIPIYAVSVWRFKRRNARLTLQSAGTDTP